MARVYVGTWGKYNSGSIAGAWIDLSKMENYAAFLAECRKVHKDERDPEFMIQDSEGFPDGLNCMEWLSEADFNDVKAAMKEEAEEEGQGSVSASFTVVDYSEKAIAVTGDTRAISDQLKALGGRFNPRLSCGAGWVFSKRKEQEVRAILAGAKVDEKAGVPVQKEKEGAAWVACKDEWIASMKSGDKDYYRKRYAAAVKLAEGYFTIEKPGIQNKFCFHDEGPDYEYYCSLMDDNAKLRRHFLRENLSDLDDQIARMENKSEDLFLVREDWNNTVRAYTNAGLGRCYKAQRDTARVLTDDERKTLAQALRFVRDGFEKRLQTYLKKYGTAKLHTWTYWADA